MIGTSNARSVSLVGPFLALALLAGCQDEKARPVVGLDEALAMTAAIEQPVAPPPRTINDVLAMLEKVRPDPEYVAGQKRLADAQPPTGASPAQLAQHYLTRHFAARNLGRFTQSLDDARKAYPLAKQAGVYPHRYISILAGAEAIAGNRRRVIELLLEGTRTVQHGQRGDGIWAPQARMLNYAAILSMDYAQLGEFDEAARWLAQSELILKEAEHWVVPSRNKYVFDVSGPILADQVERSRAVSASARGDTAEALSHMRASLASADRLRQFRARATYDYWPDPAEQSGWVYAGRVSLLAQYLRDQNRLVESETETRRALALFVERQGAVSSEISLQLVRLARVMLEQGRLNEAEQLALRAAAMSKMAGDEALSPRSVEAQATLAAAYVRQDRLVEANRVFDDTLAALRGAGRGTGRIRFDTDRHYALTRAGRASEAISPLREQVGRNTEVYGAAHRRTLNARAMLGVALLADGQQAGALAELDGSVDQLLAAARGGAGDEQAAGREMQLRWIVDAHVEALTRGGGGAGVARAFRTADSVRGRGVGQALAASASRAATLDPALADLMRREQDAGRRIEAMHRAVGEQYALPAADRRERTIAELRADAERLAAARAALIAEIARRFPDYRSLIDPEPATVEAAQRALTADEALIATYVAREATYVWAMRRQGPVAFAAVPIGRAALAERVGRLRGALEPKAETLGDIPRFDVEEAHRLFAELLRPVAAGWSGARRLVVVADGPLGQLPFQLLLSEPAALPDEDESEGLFANYRKLPWLLRQASVYAVPAASSLVALRGLPAGAAGRRPFIGFGDPAFGGPAARQAEPATRGAPTRVVARGLPLARRSGPGTRDFDSAQLAQLPALPDTAEELRAVAAALGADAARDVFLGPAASERAVRAAKLDDRRVVMFATHALVPGDLNGLTQPALALSAPAVADVDNDGLLTLDEILALKLDADWVVLSACNTAAADGAGAEAVSGLGRAFFYAGTRALLVSHWPVETTSARALTTDLFRRQAADPGLGRAEALRQTMLAMIAGPGALDADGRTIFSYAHPIFWAPFALVGDGGGGARPGG